MKKMKKIKPVLACYFLCTVFNSCSPQTGSNNFIPGTYVRMVTNEFSVGLDTLVIGAVNQHMYTIIHKGSYRRIKENALLPVQRLSENWTATYDENKKVLVESKRGKIISFDPSKNILFVGSSLYKKIK
jgi:hypothetical protein